MLILLIINRLGLRVIPLVPLPLLARGGGPRAVHGDRTRARELRSAHHHGERGHVQRRRGHHLRRSIHHRECVRVCVCVFHHASS